MGFAAPWALLGLLAVGVPIVAHLLRRRDVPLRALPTIALLRKADVAIRGLLLVDDLRAPEVPLTNGHIEATPRPR